MKTSRAVDILRFAVVVAITVAALALLNLLPRAFGGEPRTIVRYGSLAQVEARYRTSLWRPRALPDPYSVAAPIVRVAPGTPDWVQLVFASPRAATLVICQTASAVEDAAEVNGDLLPAGDVLQVNEIAVAGRQARVRRLLLGDGEIVHELWWREGGRNVMLRLRAPAADVLALARLALGTAP
jgi:hypothetical protein